MGERTPCDIIWIRTPYNRHVVYLNNLHLCVIDHVEIMPSNNPEYYSAILNSTLYALFREFYGRSNLGLGTLKTEVMDVKQVPLPNIEKLNKSQILKLESAFSKLCNRPIGSVFEEIGANNPEEVTLDKVKHDRKELDAVIFDILWLNEKERLEVYKAVVDLVKARIDKAKSVAKKKSIKGIDIKALVEIMLKEIGEIKKFPEDYIGKSEVEIIKVPKGKAEIFSDIHGFHIKIGEKELICKTPYESKYILYAIKNKNKKTSIKIPKNETIIKKVVEEYSLYLDKVKNKINGLLQYRIPDSKIKEKVKNELWKYIFS